MEGPPLPWQATRADHSAASKLNFHMERDGFMNHLISPINPTQMDPKGTNRTYYIVNGVVSIASAILAVLTLILFRNVISPQTAWLLTFCILASAGFGAYFLRKARR